MSKHHNHVDDFYVDDLIDIDNELYLDNDNELYLDNDDNIDYVTKLEHNDELEHNHDDHPVPDLHNDDHHRSAVLLSCYDGD
jgi:hypothetical protein